jgi:hypothetical protein
MLLYSRATRAARVLPEEIGRAVLRLARRGGRPPALAEDALAALAADGLLPAPDDVRARLAREAGEDPDPTISLLGVTTRDRPHALQRALDSYAANARAHGRQPSIVVTDDSAGPAARAGTRAMLRALGARHGLSVEYGGAEEKRAFAAALARASGVAPALIEFALFDPEGCGYTSGANTNALLLHAAGERLVRVDDDTVCRLAAVAGPDAPLRLGAPPMQLRPFPSHEAAVRAAAFTGADFLGLHERYLGRPLAAVAGAAARAGRLALDRPAPGIVKQIWSGGRVVASALGVVGDVGWDTLHRYLLLAGPSRAALVRSADAYRQALGSGRVIRASAQPALAERSLFQMMCTGLDNRDPLPPLVPVLRGSDTVFARTVGHGDGDAVAVLPWVVEHLREEPRALAPERVAGDFARAPFFQFLLSCLEAGPAPWPGRNRAERIRQVGRHLQRLGALPAGDWDAFVTRRRRHRASRLIEELRRARDRYRGEPAFWARDVDRALAALQADLLAPATVADDLAAGRDAAAAHALGRRLVARFGDLLVAWPDLVATARNLRARGVRLARPL